jgi:hypothetical protein
MKDGLRSKGIQLASSLAQQESEKSGQSYTKCISKGLDEACIRLGVSKKDFIKMFI